jgi:glycosyltransferase involved in cell wall biosynthesis
MRVLMTADCAGGVWTYALELADALAEHDVETVLVVTGAPLAAGQRRELRRSAVERCHARELALEWMPDPWRDVERAGEWLLELADEVEPDVVHVNGYAHAALRFERPVVCVAHSCVLSWFDAVHRRPAPPEWARYRGEVERGLRAADVVVAPTAAMVGALRRHYAFETETRVIPNGVAAHAHTAPKEPFVLAAGRLWDEAKNLAALERVARLTSWTLEIVGPPRHVLARDELRERMSRAAVFCAPALYEPFGLAPLEAAGAACALVLGDIPSLREVWRDAALYADPRDDEAIAAAIDRAFAEPEWSERACRRAHAYSAEGMGDAYLELYERLTTETLDAVAEAVR